jgi:hypothetical protein
MPAEALVLTRAELDQGFGVCWEEPGEFARGLGFSYGIYFQYDGEQGAYVYENVRDSCKLTIGKDFSLSFSRPAAAGKEKK